MSHRSLDLKSIQLYHETMISSDTQSSKSLTDKLIDMTRMYNTNFYS